MGFYDRIISDLSEGKTVKVRLSGNSMTPLIKSKQLVTIAPISTEIKKGDIVLCKVKGRIYLHLVTAIKNSSYRISNNHNHVNGWTKIIFGKCIKVED